MRSGARLNQVIDAEIALIERWISPRVLGWLLISLIGVALLVRLVWIWRYGLVIENESTQYARIAQSLAEGSGFVGTLGDRQTLAPPLFPVLIVFLAPFAGGEELAGRLISCFSGLLLIFAAFEIARHIAGRHAGIAAAGIVGGHAVAIGFSAAGYGEGLYFALLFSATALLLRAIQQPSVVSWLVTGVAYGLAYLTRPETVAYFALALVFGAIMLGRGNTIFQTGRLLAIATLAFAILAAPYVWWLSSNSGYFRLEGKSIFTGIVAESMSQGMSYHEATRRISPDLEPLGPDLIADQFEYPRPAGVGLTSALQTVAQNLLPGTRRVLSIWIGEPDTGNARMAALAVLGLIASMFVRRARATAVLFLCMTGGYIAMLLSISFYEWLRYIYPLTFFVIIWAAVGIATAASASSRAVHRLGMSSRAQILVISFVLVVGVASVTVPSLPMRYGSVFGESHSPYAQVLRGAGEEISSFGIEQPRVMTLSSVISYYANGDLVYYPWVREDETSLALRFIHDRKPDFLVLRTAELEFLPFTKTWLGDGVPDQCAEELSRRSEPPSGELIVYRWNCAG